MKNARAPSAPHRRTIAGPDSLAASRAVEQHGGMALSYLETGAQRAVKADGSFFELPHPVMEKRAPDEAQFRDKLDWVAQHLRPVR